jgi:glycosyltransferase 2 family protein
MKHNGLILILVGLGILAAMILFIGPEQIVKALEKANPIFIVLAIITQLVIYGLLTLRWSITTDAIKINVKKRHLLPMLMVGLAVNNITPSARGGGEPVRAYILSKYSRCSMESSFATVIADRGLDMFPFIVLAVLTIFAIVMYFNLALWLVLSLIMAVIVLTILFILALYMSLNKKAGEKITRTILKVIRRFYKKNPEKLEKKALNAIHEFQYTMKLMLKERKIFFYALPLSFLIWGLEILRVYLVFSSFGIEVSLILIAVVFIIASLIGMIPLLPGGLGAVDGIMILLYSAAGIPPSISAAATVIERLISFWMTSIIGIACLPYFGSSVIEKITKKI